MLSYSKTETLRSENGTFELHGMIHQASYTMAYWLKIVWSIQHLSRCSNYKSNFSYSFLKYREFYGVFRKYQILTVHGLFAYELFNSVLRSINEMHADSYLSNLSIFESQSTYTNTRSMKYSWSYLNASSALTAIHWSSEEQNWWISKKMSYCWTWRTGPNIVNEIRDN